MTFLNPLIALPAVFGTGYLIWYLVMPVEIQVRGTAPRYIGDDAHFRFFVFAMALLLGMVLGALRGTPERSTGVALPYRVWLRIGVAAVGIYIFGELMYVREAIANPAILGQDLVGVVAALTAEVHAESFGLHSVLNIYPVPASIGALILFSKDKDITKKERLFAALILAAVLFISFLHGFLLSARIVFLNVLAIVAVCFALTRNIGLVREGLAAALLVPVLAVLVVAAEMTRVLGWQARTLGIELWTPEVAQVAIDRLVQGYIASDINNALIVLQCNSGMEVFSAFGSLTNIVRRVLGVEFVYWSQVCSDFTSLYGTMNFIGMLWWDFAYFGVIPAFILGFMIQRTYMLARASVNREMSIALVIFPHLWFVSIHLSRSNDFGATYFVLPLLFVVGVVLFAQTRARSKLAVA